MSKIRIGDKVKIVDVEAVYPYYEGFLYHNQFHDCLDKFVRGSVPNIDGTYIVLKLRQDPREEEIVRMAIIMDEITGQLFVIKRDGLALVDKTILNESSQAAQDLRSVVTSLVSLISLISEISPTKQEDVVDDIYNSVEMIRLRNFIEKH